MLTNPRAAFSGQSMSSTQLQNYFGRFTSCMTFGAHKLLRSDFRAIFGIPIGSLTLAVGAIQRRA